ncbi:TPA: LysR family transcriptional regulator [Kluyvera cryocrescens]|nr:LysR family transcriptional regulator [Kluyvera cryocrescens]
MKTEKNNFDTNQLECIKRVDLNTVLYFVTVMNYKTIFNASIVMNCSPPTVSIMLKRFCSYFPVPLFEKEGRNLIPTRYAHELYKKIEVMLREIEKALSDVQ